MRYRILSLPLLLLLSLHPAKSLAQDDPTYIVADWLIDTLQGERVADPVIEISNGRIVSVSTGTEIPAGASVIDLGEMTILPGLADMHTHLTGYSTDFGYESLALSDTDMAIRGVVNARVTVMAGFTAARNLGAPGYADVSLRNAINDGRIPDDPV